MTPRKFLFICTGNTCRSAIAEKLFAKLARDKGMDVEARSCGIAAQSRFPVPAGTRKALAAHGVAQFEHVPQPASRELLGWADVILAMAEEHHDAVVERYPEFVDKVNLLRAHVNLSPENVEDPIGQSDEVYLDCAKLIREALEALIKKYESIPAEKPRP